MQKIWDHGGYDAQGHPLHQWHSWEPASQRWDFSLFLLSQTYFESPISPITLWTKPFWILSAFPISCPLSLPLPFEVGTLVLFIEEGREVQTNLTTVKLSWDHKPELSRTLHRPAWTMLLLLRPHWILRRKTPCYNLLKGKLNNLSSQAGAEAWGKIKTTHTGKCFGFFSLLFVCFVFLNHVQEKSQKKDLVSQLLQRQLASFFPNLSGVQGLDPGVWHYKPINSVPKSLRALSKQN